MRKINRIRELETKLQILEDEHYASMNVILKAVYPGKFDLGDPVEVQIYSDGGIFRAVVVDKLWNNNTEIVDGHWEYALWFPTDTRSGLLRVFEFNGLVDSVYRIRKIEKDA